jgi:hypothetical protein
MAKTAPHNPHEIIPEAPDTITAMARYAVEQNAVATMSAAPALPMGVQSYTALLAGADEVAGHDLAEKTTLIGIPFVITSATFRDGILRPDKTPTNYVSLEAVVADKAALDMRVAAGRLAADKARQVTPNEAIVINDGSSGICRQVVAYLAAKGLIQVPAGTEVGPANSTRYDVYRASWLHGFDVDDPNPRFDIVLACRRGLRVSEYESDWGPAGTFYLA